MAVLAGENHGPAGPADRVRHDAPIEAHAFTGQTIDLWRFDQAAGIVVGTDGLESVVVAENK